ncbi:MOSC domain-containing protein [Brevibacillus dissolubilis]|uniref:MOSC domain-containing protein n=1 Tax=Brevibacillus dissolubilis TaxID=1844116 RepID=UPI0011171B2D|nr:MOSC domain-containing protein [Brevibacillus dissolubilis]
MNILSLNIGKAQDLTTENGETYRSAIMKQAVTEPLRLEELGFIGDEQANLEYHGGPHKAVCVYSYDRYPHWEQLSGRKLSMPAFGENITIEGWNEEQVHVGDIFRLGEAVVQISQPRQPCQKISYRQNWQDLTKQVLDTHYTGYYLRVLEAGMVDPSGQLILLEKDPAAMTVHEATDIMFFQTKSREATEKLLAVKALSPNWRERLEKRLV